MDRFEEHTVFEAASARAKYVAEKWGKPIDVLRTATGWVLCTTETLDRHDFANLLRVADDLPPVTRSRPQISRDHSADADFDRAIGAPVGDLDDYEVGGKKYEFPTAQTNAVLIEGGKPGDYRPEGTALCYICSGAGSLNHASCTKCRGRGFLR